MTRQEQTLVSPAPILDGPASPPSIAAPARPRFQHGYNDPRFAFLYWGLRRHCPCCGGRFRRFLEHGFGSRRPDARCPRCWSLERHRLVWVFLQQRTRLLLDRLRVLHMAPEKALRSLLSRQRNLDYVTADLDGRRGMLQMDLARSGQPDASFDVILCSHVLEHIPDDRQAMRELHRMLRPDGWALILTPCRWDRRTDEDPAVVDPEERTRRFGQPDHVRFYGADLPDRLRSVGFDVEVVRIAEVMTPQQQERWGARDATAGQLFLCRRTPGTALASPLSLPQP